jgi:hypothetical protein
MSEGDINKHDELERRVIYEDPEGKKVTLNKEIPFNHKWFKGEFHLEPWGSSASPFGGRPKDRVRVSMPGKEMRFTTRNNTQSSYGVITAVIEEEDRQFIGKFGWWVKENLSDSGKKIKRRNKI